MYNSMIWLGAAALSGLLALTGLYWFSRPSWRASLSGLGLMLLATATAFTSWQQLTPPPTTPAPADLTQARQGHFLRITPDQLAPSLAAARGQAVLLEFYADWCSSCQHWETEVFAKPEVQQALTGLTLLQLDASDFSPEAQAALTRFGLQGLPAVLSIDHQGQELPTLRLLGEMSAADFLLWLQQDFHTAIKGS